MTLVPGSMLGPYEILSAIGAGGMGEVWKARDPRLGRDVAIKVLPPSLANDTDRLGRFEVEAKSASALNHPGIITVHDLGKQAGIVYLVTELIDGQNLREARPESLRRQIDIAAQVADALAAAHAKGITHRDLKPDNIMVSRDGRAKILDFGLAKQTGPLKQDEATRVGFQSEPGMVLGTVGYMAPEQVQGIGADSRSDIFSFGAVLYELLTGERAFQGNFNAEVLNAIVKNDPPAMPESVPPSLQQIVHRCLEKEPEQRFQSAKDLSFALRNANPGSATKTEILPVSTQPVKRSPWKWMAACGLMLAAGFVIHAIAFTPNYPDMASYKFIPFAIEAGAEQEPSWSPDGRTLAYVAQDERGVRQVMVRGLKSTIPLQLTKGNNQCSRPFWSPDGSRVYYVSSTKLLVVGASGGAPELVRENTQAAVLSPDGKTFAVAERDGPRGSQLLIGTISKLVPFKQAPFPDHILRGPFAFSPDGSKLGIIARSVGDEGDYSFWTLPVTSGAPRKYHFDQLQFQTLFEGAQGGVISWLPDNQRILLAAMRTGGTAAHLYLADLETSRLTAFTSGLAETTSPALSPDGKQIAFVSGGQDGDLYEVSIETGSTRPLLSTSANESRLSWLPSGNQFIYLTNASGNSEIRIRNTNEGWSRPLITKDTEGLPPWDALEHPVLAPDGERLTFEVLGESHTLWAASLSGGRPVQIAGYPQEHQHFSAWSPDGNWIIYQSTGNDRTNYVKAPSGGGGTAVQLRSAGLNCSSLPWASSGDWLLCGRPAAPTLVSSDGRQTIDLQPRSVQGFSKDGRQVYSIGHESEEGLWTLYSFDIKTRQERRLLNVDLPRNVFLSRFNLHPDGKRIAVTVSTSHADIFLMEGFQPPARWWERIWRFR